MKEVKLTSGYVALVDDCDFEKVSSRNWFPLFSRRRCDGSLLNVYAQANARYEDGRKTAIKMHRFILGLSDPSIFTDHRDHDGLNNCRSNFRICTPSENLGNARLRSDNTSGYKGVAWSKTRNKLGSAHQPKRDHGTCWYFLFRQRCRDCV